MKLPQIVRREQADSVQLLALKVSIERLALTHHGLAAEAQGNNPESISAKIAELAAAGSNLGTYYSSLPTAAPTQ
jgi:hypothetical protein